MPLPFEHDFLNPNYLPVFERRRERLEKIRANPTMFVDLRDYYRKNPLQFIIDWGIVNEPRNIRKGQPGNVPFLLYPYQEKWGEWFLERWKNGENGLSDKSRAVGLTWLAVAICVTLCLFNNDLIIGFGSRKEDYVDKRGSPKSIFHKIRHFIKYLPVEFRGGWTEKKNSTHMRIEFPFTNCVIEGEAGDNIARGGRYSIFILDESAHIMRSDLIDAALSEATDCRIDISTPKGRGNSFARRRFGGNVSVMSYSWREDPSKNQAWYEKRKKEIDDPIIVAQELDLDYSGSIDGVIIPFLWIQAAIDAHEKLGIQIGGVRKAGLDISDRGRDKNAYCGRYGILIEFLEQWTGKATDIYATTDRAILLTELLNYETVRYDGDGMGASVRGDARIINERRQENNRRKIIFDAFRAGDKILYPEKDVYYKPGVVRDSGMGILNKDFFENFKAQAWWDLKMRFYRTYLSIQCMERGEEIYYDPADLISISSKLIDTKGENLLPKLTTELSQPVFVSSGDGKIMVEKTPEDALSPNLADAVMMAFAPMEGHRGFLSV